MNACDSYFNKENEERLQKQEEKHTASTMNVLFFSFTKLTVI